MWRWIVLPGIVYTLLFGTGMYFFWNSADSAVNLLSNTIGLEAWLQQQRSEWINFLFLMAGMMLRLMLVFLYFSLFKYFVLILGAPLFAYLSEKTAQILQGGAVQISAAGVLNDSWRGIRLVLRNLLWQTVYILSYVLLALVPVFGWITPPIALFTECFYYGFSMMDYSLQRNKTPFVPSIEFITRHKGLAIGNGLMFYLMHFVVVIGWVLAPAYAVIAATLSLYKIQQEQSKPTASYEG